MTKANFTRKGDALWPVDEAAQEVLRAIKEGKELTLDVKASRNSKQSRLYFALLREICDSGAWEDGVDHLLDWCKLKCRHIDVLTINGQTVVKLRSISFESMSQDKFKTFFDRSIYFMCSELLMDEQWEKFRDEFLERVEGRFRDHREVA